MNFNVYLDKTLSKKLSHICESTHRKRNTIIREALELYIRQLNQRGWSNAILNFEGEKDIAPFESFREELGPDQRPLFLDE